MDPSPNESTETPGKECGVAAEGGIPPRSSGLTLKHSAVRGAPGGAIIPWSRAKPSITIGVDRPTSKFKQSSDIFSWLMSMKSVI